MVQKEEAYPKSAMDHIIDQTGCTKGVNLLLLTGVNQFLQPRESFLKTFQEVGVLKNFNHDPMHLHFSRNTTSFMNRNIVQWLWSQRKRESHKTLYFKRWVLTSGTTETKLQPTLNLVHVLCQHHALNFPLIILQCEDRDVIKLAKKLKLSIGGTSLGKALAIA